MKKMMAITVAFLATIVVSGPVLAAVNVDQAWVRLLPPGVKTTAAYMTITSDQADTLLSARSELSERVEVHQTTKKDGVMSMSEVSGISLTSAQVLELRPGSYHIMLINLKAPLSEGQVVELVLNFEKQGEQVVRAEVQKR